MEKSPTEILEKVAVLREVSDQLSVKRWLLVYAAWLGALVVPAGVLLSGLPGEWRALFLRPGDFTAPSEQVLKLLIFATYVSVSCTFLPLPTGWIVAALATRAVALSQNVWITTALVAGFGAAGSTMANLHDYHVFTWMLRHRRIGRVRTTKLHLRAARWFARQPFALLVAFNILPIPIDVVRMLSATCRYSLRPFVAANFVGRWIRYAVLAFVTFQLGPRGGMAVIALLAGAVVLGLTRFIQQIRHGREGAGDGAATSVTMERGKERQQ